MRRVPGSILPLVLVALASTLAACTPGHVDLIPDADDYSVGKRGHVAAEYRVPESGAGGLDVRVSSRGARRKKKKGGGSVIVTATVVVENRGERAATFYEGSSALLDRDRRMCVPLFPAGVAAVGSGGLQVPLSADSTARRLGPVDLAPGERRTFELSFRSDRTRDPREVEPCSLLLEFSYAGHDYPLEAKLVLDPSAQYYYGYPYGYGYPGYGWGWGMGPAWGWGPGWYGPGWGWGSYGYGWGPYF